MCRLRTRSRTDVDPPRVELPSAGAYRLAAPGAITRYYQGSNRSMSARSIWLAFEDLLSHNGSHLRQERTYLELCSPARRLRRFPSLCLSSSRKSVFDRNSWTDRAVFAQPASFRRHVFYAVSPRIKALPTGTSSHAVDLENLAVENLTSACRPLPRVVADLYT